MLSKLQKSIAQYETLRGGQRIEPMRDMYNFFAEQQRGPGLVSPGALAGGEDDFESVAELAQKSNRVAEFGLDRLK